jgi:hypothetical protein
VGLGRLARVADLDCVFNVPKRHGNFHISFESTFTYVDTYDIQNAGCNSLPGTVTIRDAASVPGVVYATPTVYILYIRSAMTMSYVPHALTAQTVLSHISHGPWPVRGQRSGTLNTQSATHLRTR